MILNPGLREITQRAIFSAIFFCLLCSSCSSIKHGSAVELERISISKSGNDFTLVDSARRFVAWGVNYDHDRAGRLLEDYWHDEWPTVEEDFSEIKALGANVVRIHLQTAKFMKAPGCPDEKSLRQLERLVDLAEKTGLYLDITGLGCYHKADVPEWYDAMTEAERWDVQALFWESVASICRGSPAIFCYDLMNEPVLAGAGKTESDWLVGEFAGKYFVQRITLDLAGREREDVAAAWVDKLVTAIRKHDKSHLITVGVIPWAHTWPGASPIFYSKKASGKLDFVSVHFYPDAGKVDRAIKALETYDIGKPIVVEEMFPLKCSSEDMGEFINASRGIADGWISFYWGKTINEYTSENSDITSAIIKNWLEYYRDRAPGRSLKSALSTP